MRHENETTEESRTRVRHSIRYYSYDPRYSAGPSYSEAFRELLKSVEALEKRVRELEGRAR